jgi:pyridoxal phosphate enzyme (YggS family)
VSATVVHPDQVADRVADVRRTITEAGGDPARVTLVAVTKGFGPDAVSAARGAGIDDLGENYADELVAKAETEPGARWHFLGALQRNKAKRLAPHVAVWEAVDRLAAVDAIARRAPGAAALVQVNLVGDPAKHGCVPADAPGLVAHACDAGLDVRGLMTVGPAGDRDGARTCFRTLARLGRDLGLAELSMGMSNDYDVAVSEGATTIRLGRTLFGARPPRAASQH